MKHFKKLIIAVLCIVLLSSIFSMLKIEPKAATGTTYYIRRMGDDFYVCDVPWNVGDVVTPFPASILDYRLNDGDNIVLYSGGFDFNQTFTKKIGVLTVSEAGFTMITAPSFEIVNVMSSAKAVINGDVADAYVYDAGVANFNNNVNTLHLVETSMKKQTVNVLGTVGCAEEYKYGEAATSKYYNFAAGSCIYSQGSLNAQAGTYTLAPGSYVPTVPSVPGKGGNDLDDVPKTGEMNLRMSILLLALSALCTTGAYVLYRKKA